MLNNKSLFYIYIHYILVHLDPVGHHQYRQAADQRNMARGRTQQAVTDEVLAPAAQYDHFGLVSKLATDTTNILFSRPEKELMESWEGFGAMVDYAARSGFPENELEAALDKHPGAKYGADWIPELKILDDGDHIDVADYHFKCVTTPGHTLGHTCLYDQDKKILLAGDHILSI